MIKAIAGQHFSLTVFAFSQIAMDIEPLIGMFRGSTHLHGFTHTYLGATLLALAAMTCGKPICQGCLNLWNSRLQSKHSQWMQLPASISWRVAGSSAFLGCYSHVFLDSLMHFDQQPFAPFSTSNSLLYSLSIEENYLMCSLLGIIGTLIILLRSVWKKHTINTA